MTRALICTGVLGGGTAVVFGLALAASLLFPQGSLVPVGWGGGWAGPKPMPMVGNAFGGGAWTDDVIVPRTGPLVVEPAVPAPAQAQGES